MSDAMLFMDEPETQDEAPYEEEWKVLIVDDEPEIHQITRIVLQGFSVDNKSLNLISAHSAKEAKDILTSDEGRDIAVAVVDVVMETHNAGLELVRWVRDELQNKNIRLVLRTGQPGEAPEESVIRDYDLNDYKNKTELTALKLKTLFYSALRGYRDILMIERQKEGLVKVIGATSEFIECDTLPQFASAILKQVVCVLGIESQSVVCCAAAKEHDGSSEQLKVLAINHNGSVASENRLPDNIEKRIKQALSQKQTQRNQDHFVGYFTTKRGTENLLYVAHDGDLEPVQHSLLEFFASNIAVAHENLKLREMIRESQKELSYVIGEAVEMRSKETGSHVKRVAHISYKLAKYVGLSEYEAEMIKLASPLHDVGKVGIPDAILNKPGQHDPDESEVMQTHAQIGYDMLKKSDNPILNKGATIAQQHHEKWNGLGYPSGLVGEQIDIAGRITALADVFDALGSRRCYKDAWAEEAIVEFIRDERGKHFDPQLVDIMIENIQEFFEIRTLYPDPH